MMIQAEIIVLTIIVPARSQAGRQAASSPVGPTCNKTSIAGANSGGVPWHTCSTHRTGDCRYLESRWRV